LLEPSRAFTLIELILVMTILVLVVSMLAPSLRGFGIGRSNDNAARQLVSLAKYARAQAISEGRRYRLSFDTQNNAFWLTAEQGGTFTSPSNDFGRRIDAPEGVTIQTDLTQQADGLFVDFLPTGRTQAVHIWLTDKLGNTIQVACDSPTEMFRVLPPGEVSR
jgi:prepilin-type N-terminal cleavage/methylation domain-containing protein